jgi:hypothetical protein
MSVNHTGRGSCGRRTRKRQVKRVAALTLKQVEDLAIQRALAIVLEMMDGERRDDGVEAFKGG